MVFQDEFGYYNVKYQGLSIYTLKAVSEIARYIDSDGNADFTRLNSDQIFTSGIGQQYESAEADLTSGDVVTVSQNGAVRRSGGSYETGLVGVVTSGTGLLVGEQTSNSVTVAAAGKVPVRVNTQNGAIQPGDYLTSSDTPGVAMRATGNGPVIGMATTGFSGAGEGRVTVSVANSTVASAFGIQLDGLESRLSQLESRVDEINNGLSQSGQPIDLSNLTVGNLKVTLDMFTDGALVVSGPAEFRGNTIFDALVSFGDSVLFNGDVAVKGTATFNNNTAGYAVISQGRNSVHVSFTKPYAQAPLITVSLGGGKFAQYSYDNVTENGFDIVMAGPALEDLKFSWAAMSIDNPNTFVQQ